MELKYRKNQLDWSFNEEIIIYLDAVAPFKLQDFLVRTLRERNVQAAIHFCYPDIENNKFWTQRSKEVCESFQSILALRSAGTPIHVQTLYNNTTFYGYF